MKWAALGTITPSVPRLREFTVFEHLKLLPETVEGEFCMVTQVVPAPVSMVKYCGVPLGSTMIVVPSLKDWAAEKVRTFVPEVVLTVPDPVMRFRTLDAGIAPALPVRSEHRGHTAISMLRRHRERCAPAGRECKGSAKRATYPRSIAKYL
jgi:hypothetical protein